VQPKQDLPTPTPGLAAVALSTTTPIPTVVRPSPTTVSEENNTPIRVLNGSGIAGTAGKMKDALEALGYTDITTGNADAFTYTDITIRAQSPQQQAVLQLRDALAKDHTVHAVERSASASGTIIVIVGK
jgi:hypothetical protein